MNKTQYEVLTTIVSPEASMAQAKALYDQSPRTLVYGYTTDKNTFHVYLADGKIHKVVYGYPDKLLEHKTQDANLLFEECAPNKRMYPEACDFEFCSLLRRHGVHLPFTTWNDKRERAAFYGKQLEELQTPALASVDLDIPVNAEGWNLDPRRDESDMAAALLAPKLRELLLAARAANLRTLDEAVRIRDVMYLEMDVYRHLGARDAAAEWMLVALIECALGLPAQTLAR